jgi:outer membrane protein
MNKNKLVLVMLAVACAFSMNAQKYGYLNTEELIVSLPEVKDANVTIENMKDSLTNEAKAMVADLQKKYKDLEAKVNDIAPNQLKIERQKLQDEEQKLQEFDQNSQQQIYLKSEMLLGPIQEKINKAILEVASEGGYTYIFDTSAGNVLYVDETLNVSELVRAKL